MDRGAAVAADRDHGRPDRAAGADQLGAREGDRHLPGRLRVLRDRDRAAGRDRRARRGGFGGLAEVRNISPHLLLGGLLGAAYVTTVLVTVRTLGAGGVTAATITGQLTMSVVVDQFGWLGVEKEPITLDPGGRVAPARGGDLPDRPGLEGGTRHGARHGADRRHARHEGGGARLHARPARARRRGGDPRRRGDARASRRSRRTSRASSWPPRRAPTSRRCARRATAARRSRRWPRPPGRSRRACTPRAGSPGCSAPAARGTRRSRRRAMQAVPVGVPKLMVSTVAAGDTSDYLGASDVTMMPSVADVAGLNSISRADPGQRGGGDGRHGQRARRSSSPTARPLVGATMFGVTTPCVEAAREALEARGYEVLVFHATGTGGRAMEGLVEAGLLAGVLDITTTELGRRAGRRRVLRRARPPGGGGPRRAPAGRLARRARHGQLRRPRHGARAVRRPHVLRPQPAVTLMRTTPEENAELGRRIAAKLAAATGPTALFVPLRRRLGHRRRGPALPRPRGRRGAVRRAARRPRGQPSVELVELDRNVNDPAFATRDGRPRLDEMHRRHAR